MRHFIKTAQGLILVMFLIAEPLLAADCVILLHGLGRTSVSLNRISNALSQENYQVANINYRSRSGPIQEISLPAVEAGLSECENSERISFVTHSMGGIMLRYYLENHTMENLHRVVMLAPPNQGSRVVDAFRRIPGYKLLNGRSGLQLGTDEDSLPLNLGAVDFDLGIIAGNRSINIILSTFLENPDDGKVSVSSTRVDGMCAFVEMPVTHAMMMRNRKVINEIINYLSVGIFSVEQAENGLCAQR